MRRGSCTFGWDSKLRKTDDFSSVFRFKRVQRGTNLDIFFRENELGHARLGLIVPKKLLPRAVDRNRIRRVLREAFRLTQVELGGLDVVIRLKAVGLDADYRTQWRRFLVKRGKPAVAAPGNEMNG